MNEIQPKSIRTLKIPDFYSEYRDKGEGYAAFLGSSIVAKVGPSINNSSPRFSDDGHGSLSSEGDVPRVSNQELREQSRVWREWSVGDHWDVPGITVARLGYGCLYTSPFPTRGVPALLRDIGRCDLRSLIFARNGMRIFVRR